VVVVRPLNLGESADGELVESARRGNVAAYEQIVERYREPVFRAAYLITRSSADAQEVAQDVFVKAFGALGRFRTGAPLRPWLVQIAVNESRNRLRSVARRDALAIRAAAERPPEGSDQSPEAALLAGERRRELLTALERLREEDRLAIACRFLPRSVRTRGGAGARLAPRHVQIAAVARAHAPARRAEGLGPVNELEQVLQALGSELSYPPTPNIGPAVVERVRSHGVPRHAATRRTIAIAVAAILLVASGAIAAVPAARHTVLRWLGLRSVKIERVPTQPTVPPARASGAGLAPGRRTTQAGARASVHFHVLVPRRMGLGAPRVYVSPAPPGGRVTLFYAARILITQFRGEQSTAFLGKTLGPGTTAERLTIRGEAAVWIAGRPHLVVFRDAHGSVRADTLRLATNTLLWRDGEVLVRIEAHISKTAALAIARSMR
jgi:RNA polymerase sigma factor (sigma-70 family)